jgi:hypothetical protein
MSDKKPDNNEEEFEVSLDDLYDPKLAERARKLDEDIKSGKVKPITVVKGDERFKGFD